jgi:hypothetical protein
VTDDLTIHPTRVTGLVPPLAEAVSRSGLRADPCTNVRCLSLGLRRADEPVALTCKLCGFPTLTAEYREQRARDLARLAVAGEERTS